MRAITLFIASIAGLSGAAAAQVTTGNDLTVANMRACMKSMGKDPARWLNKTGETAALICDGHASNNGSEKAMQLRFKSKRSRLQVEINQLNYSATIKARTEAGVVYNYIHQKSNPVPVRNALQQGNIFFQTLKF